MSKEEIPEPDPCEAQVHEDRLGRMITVEVIHDFKNILTGILGNLALAKDWSDPKDRAYPFIEAAERVTRHASQLTLQLLANARGKEWERVPVSLSRMLRDCSELMISGSNCRAELNIESDLRLILGDEARLIQVFNNLLINAKQAMEKGGRVEIVLDNVLLALGSGTRLEPGPYVRVKIRDEGCGIRKEHMGELFKLHFTTKTEGNGIGLASCFYIVKNHGGTVEVESEVGVGTCFTVYLPASSEWDPLAQPTESNVAFGAKILVMDDDAMIQQTIGDLLEYLGHSVEFADDGHEALRNYRRAKESGIPYTVVVMDLTIPGGMGGLEAIRKLKEYDKDVVAIVSSGHPNDPVMLNHERFGFRAAIRKPYTLRDLQDVIARVIPSKL